jgi:hypothetical protein
LFVGPEFRLLCLDIGTIQLRDPLLPFFPAWTPGGVVARHAQASIRHANAVELRYLKRDCSPVIETLV